MSNGYMYSGSDSIDDVAWHRGNSGKWLFRKTRPVGTKRANELGIHDMSGNVTEWTVNELGTDALFRGGDWLSYLQFCRIFWYENYASGDPVKTLGLRLAMSSDKPAPSTSPPDVSSNPDSIAMVFVEGGMFTMGCGPGDDCSYRNGAPLGSFYMGKYEVTQGLWKAVMGYNPSMYLGDDNLPVEQVETYYQHYKIKEFIEKLNAKTGKKYRLPTGAEWEYASLGGNRSKGYTYSGSNNIDDVAWYNDNSCGKTHPVGTKQPNELGLHDMTGNVSEETAPKDDSSSGRARGGSWKYRVSCDDCGGWREYEKYYIGFRLAHDP
jgi:formylglycine-generating enzyme required for sulfatase activity